jgi:peptidyl-prolyl cis-trans isomerase D
MLQTLRSHMKLVLWITVIFFVLLIFLVWGANLEFGGPKQSNRPHGNVVGLVNGEPIEATTYQQLLSMNRQNIRNQGQELDPGDETRLEDQTWGLLVDELLLQQEAKKRGLQAHDAEVRATLLNSPPSIVLQSPSFKNDKGQFDFAKYQQVLRDPATPETFLLQLESYVRDSLPTMKLQAMVQAGAKVTDEELRHDYAESNEKVKVTYVMLHLPPIRGNQVPSDADVAAYFKEHSDEYRVPRRVDLLYVALARQATPADSLRVRQDVAQMANEARQAEAARTAGKENLGVSDFATLAASFSDAPNADQGGLSPAFLKPTDLPPPMAAAIANLKPGDVSDPYLDEGSYHIVQLAEEKVEKGERQIKVRDLGVRIAPSDSTVQENQEALEKVRTDALSSGLKAAARKHQLATRTVSDVIASGITPGLAALPEIGLWAHRQKTGTLSRVLATTNAWFLVEVGAFKPEGVAPLETVQDRIKVEIERQRLLDGLRPRAEALVARVRGGATLEAAAGLDSLKAVTTTEFTRQTGIPAVGRDPDVLAAAFELPVGQVSDPIRTERGWFVIRVEDRPALDWSGFDAKKEQLRQASLSAKGNQLMTEFLQELRSKAKIVDYRSS